MTKIVVGFAGHRLNRLPPGEVLRIETQIAAVLRRLQGAREATDCTLINGAAEGADQLAATTALALGWRFVALLPFSRARYLMDFKTAAARRALEDLLERASKVIERPEGDGLAPASEAYARQGEDLVARCDAMLAVWDGEASRGPGGTADAIDLARRDGIAITWISTVPGSDVSEIAP